MAIERMGLREQQCMIRAGQIAAETLAWVGAQLRTGITTKQIDHWVRDDTRRRGGRPSQLGYKGFSAAVCTSVNQVVCHGVPRADMVLREGDIINIDVTTEVDGFHGDTSETFTIGQVSDEAKRLVHTARLCRDRAISLVAPGARLGDIGAEIQRFAESNGFSVVKDYTGHGIGRSMHQPPEIRHYGKKGTGLRLYEGMAFTIEPMINAGAENVRVLDDRWTVVTADGSLSAQFEHTVIVTHDGVLITTKIP